MLQLQFCFLLFPFMKIMKPSMVAAVFLGIFLFSGLQPAYAFGPGRGHGRLDLDDDARAAVREAVQACRESSDDREAMRACKLNALEPYISDEQFATLQERAENGHAFGHRRGHRGMKRAVFGVLDEDTRDAIKECHSTAETREEKRACAEEHLPDEIKAIHADAKECAENAETREEKRECRKTAREALQSLSLSE